MSTSFEIEKFINGEILLDIPRAGGICSISNKTFRTPSSFIFFDTVTQEETPRSYILTFNTKGIPSAGVIIPKDSRVIEDV